MAWSPGPTHDVHQAEDRLLGAGERRARRRVSMVSYSAAISRAEQRVAGRLGVAEAEARPTARASRRRRARAARPSGSPRRPRRRAGARPRTPSGRSSARGRTRRCARPMMRHHAGAWTRPIAIVGVPTALGGHLSGMERTPAGLRALGLARRGCAARPGLAGRRAARRRRPGHRPGLPARPGSAGEEPGGDLRLPAARARPRRGGARARRRRRTTRACSCSAATARRMPGRWPGCAPPDRRARLAIAWFDAHGDFNTPDTTPSGNVWGMPFAMLCGRGDPDLVAAADGPTVMEQDAALFGGQVLDETESRMLAASRVAHFGAGMLGDRRPDEPRSTAGPARRIASRRALHRLRHGLPRRQRAAGR